MALFKAIGNRCLMDVGDLGHSRLDIARVLWSRGYLIASDIDMVAIARLLVGRSRYRRGAAPGEWPGMIDCSGLIKWLYGLAGADMPRLAHEQFMLGRSVDPDSRLAGDLIFTSGRRGLSPIDPRGLIGHVGMATGEGTVIHARSRAGVEESSWDRFMRGRRFRGIRRVLPERERRFIVIAPPGAEIASSADIIELIRSDLKR